MKWRRNWPAAVEHRGGKVCTQGNAEERHWTFNYLDQVLYAAVYPLATAGDYFTDTNIYIFLKSKYFFPAKSSSRGGDRIPPKKHTHTSERTGGWSTVSTLTAHCRKVNWFYLMHLLWKDASSNDLFVPTGFNAVCRFSFTCCPGLPN